MSDSSTPGGATGSDDSGRGNGSDGRSGDAPTGRFPAVGGTASSGDANVPTPPASDERAADDEAPVDLGEFFDSHAEWTGDDPVPPTPSAIGDSADHPEPGTPSPTALSRRSRRMRQRRHRRRRGRIVVIVVVAAVILSLLAVGVHAGYRTLSGWRVGMASSTSASLDYPGPGTGSVEFTVSTGEGVSSVAERLVKASVVKTADAFSSVVAANGSTLYPGTYELKRHMSASDAVAILSDQSKAQGVLQVKSGERVSEVIAEAAKLSGIAQKEFTSIVDSGGSGILPSEANGKFEGWLEPGSYDVKSEKSASAILSSMVKARITRLDSLGVPTGSQREKILIMASIAESEVNSDQYYGKVVRVILNRLDKGMNLGMDTTVAYGLGIKASQLTDAMLADTGNAYNTRVHAGLPPGPISNPGDEALQAALNPPTGDWLYFVTTDLKTGETKFATTEDEFWKIREEYKNSNSDAN